MAGLLWEHWLSEGQRQLVVDLFDDKDSEKAKRLVQFLGAIHDLGKATPAFQLKKSFIPSKDLDGLLVEKLEVAGFRDIANLALASPFQTPHALAGQYLLSNYGLRDDIASIVGAHHGRPIASEQLVKSQIAYESNYYQSDTFDHPMRDRWANAQESIIEWALQEQGFSSIEPLPEIPQPVQVILSGLLVMADWIASNEAYFPLIPIDLSQVSNQSERLERGWSRWKKTDLWQSRTYGSIKDQYNKRFSFTPNEIQVKFADLIEQTWDPGIFILEAPMGERVIIVMGAVCVIKSRVSGTLNKYISRIA